MHTAPQPLGLVVTDDVPPRSAILIYEAEWNEEATADQHRDAVAYFLRTKGFERYAAPLPDLQPDDAVYLCTTDTASSASRQHFIDTGCYLPAKEA